MSAETIIFILLGFAIKHLIVDFPLQGPYQYLNKGTYGHPGGIQHAFWHGCGTFMLFAVSTAKVPFLVVLSLSILDFVIHYHIDWAKMKLNKKLGWGPTTHEQFWWLLGADQFLHTLTYLGFAYYLVHM